MLHASGDPHVEPLYYPIGHCYSRKALHGVARLLGLMGCAVTDTDQDSE
ncbi:MAG: hypothetical protein ACXIUM_07900 [Wenzhouxiangella sp.]